MFDLNRAHFFFKGRAALYAILKAINVRENDEIIIQAFTCLAVPNPILAIGAKPVYVDIHPDKLSLDVSKIEEKISSRTKAIIVQHTYGIPADLDGVLQITKKNNLYLIEDACHSLGSLYKSKETGSFGDASFYSFGWAKPITAGTGGCAVINNADLYHKMKKIYDEFEEPSLKDNLSIKMQHIIFSLFLNPKYFWFVRSAYRTLSNLGIIGGTFSKEELNADIFSAYKKKMPRLQKKTLIRELHSVNDNVKHRKWVVSLYEKSLEKLGLPPWNAGSDCQPVYLRYPILTKEKTRILQEARKKSIEIGDWFNSPIHPLQENEWKYVCYEKRSCPVAEKMSKQLITLPTYNKVKKENIGRSIHFLKRHL